MKKINIILLLLFGLSGCSRQSDNRIIIWHSLRPEGRLLLQQQLTQFEQQLQAADSAKWSSWSFEERFYAPEEARTNFIVAGLAGKGPALLRGASDNIGPLVELGVIQPLEPYLETAFLDSFLVEPIPAVVWYREHCYQLADEIGNHLCLVYNKKLIPNPPRTIAELIRMGQELLAHPPDANVKYALAWNYTEPYFAVPFLGGYGGWLLDEDNNPTLDTPAMIQAVQLIYDLGHKYQLIPKECDYEIANALFIDGYAAMIINGPWSWGSYFDRDMDIGITRIPMIDETGQWPSPIVSPLGYSMNSNLEGERLAVTVELLKFLTSPEVELFFTRAMGTIPSRREAWRDSVVLTDPVLQSSIYQLEVGKAMPAVTELRWIWDAMRPAYQAIFTGQLQPAEAAALMQKNAVKLIQENRE
ncbi:extracellular solute-binding protein [bacterium]|nr:extracellular solute-binding protein [bacterium]